MTMPKRVVLLLLLATATAYARPGSSGTSTTYHPSSTYHYNGSHTRGSGDLGAGGVIAIFLGVLIFVGLWSAIAHARQGSRTVQVTTPPTPRLDFTPLRTANASFSRFSFEDTVAELVRAELARRHEAKPEAVLVADIRPSAATSTHVTCTVEATIGGTYNVGHWTFERTADNTWRVDVYRDISLGRGPLLISTGREVGNDLPTLTDEQAIVRFTQIRDEDKTTSWDAFTARVRETYAKLNDAWNKQELADVDGYVTPRMIEWLRFWYAEYRRQGLVNHHADAEVRHIGLAQVTREPNLDAVTVRVYAAGFDFTTKANTTDKVAGSQTEKREYTEYWTFVRAKGSPSWLLTKIEQDELYLG
ncbi:MAG TPA: TIM44-like domain-containing protein [Kofleriaceae bacterium]|nr:TIM44-like domain-containing protein [Kofleriaceae bacterium]